MTEEDKGSVYLHIPQNVDKKGLERKSMNGSTANLRAPLTPTVVRRLSAVSASGVPVTIAVTQSPAKKQTEKGKKNGKKKKTKGSRLSGGAIFLALILAMAAVALAAWLVVEVRRMNSEMNGRIDKLNIKTDVVADSLIKDCSYAKPWARTHGITKIYPVPYPLGIKVFCDHNTDGGGWTVFQRRINGSLDFYKGWAGYEKGFGSMDKEFWLGLEKLHELTSNSGSQYELRVDMQDLAGVSVYAHYRKFRIGSAKTHYTLHVDGFSGTVKGDSLSIHNGMAFSTKDQDNDNDAIKSCATFHHGAWWYNACHSSNLNGRYSGHKAYADGIHWRHFRGDKESLKFVEMKMRRKT